MSQSSHYNQTSKMSSQPRKSVMNPIMTQNDLRVVEPYLWRKQDKRKDFVQVDFQNKPCILMRDLSMIISDTVYLPQLIRETSNILKSVTHSTGVMLYLVDSGANEIYLCPQNPDNHSEQRISWKIRTGYSVAAHVALEREIVFVNNLIKDTRFPCGISWKGITDAAVICAPVVTSEHDCFAIIELFRETSEPYDNRHLQIVTAVTGWMGEAINQNNRRVIYQKQEELNSCLQEIIQKYFGQAIDVENVLTEIVRFAKSTLNADRGSFFVLDPDSQELAAECFEDTTPLNSGKIDNIMAQKKKLKIRLNKEKGIAALAASTGKIVNIKDAFNDPRFDKEVDQKTGIITRSVLCLPVEGKGGIVGVLQLINKTNTERCFSRNDETLIKTFGVYCTIALHYKQLTENFEKTMLYNELYEGMYFYQISKNCPKPFPEEKCPENFDDLMWYPGTYFIDNGYLLPWTVNILKSIGNNRLYNIELFVYATSRAYRAEIYHNFEYAFSVTHTIYCILSRNPKKFSQNEKVALIIAGVLCAVDHRGVSNSFLKLTNHPLSKLYDNSILQHHHIWVSKIILKSTQLLKNYTERDYSEIMRLIEDAILSTDSYLYVKNINMLKSITETNAFYWSNNLHRSFACKLVLTCAVISYKAKPYNIEMRLTSNLYQELYAQGDREKLLGRKPNTLFDRDRGNKIPEYEINILNHLCIPCFQLTNQIFENLTEMLKASMRIRENWMIVIMSRGKRMWSPLEYKAREEQTDEVAEKRFEATKEEISNLMFN